MSDELYWDSTQEEVSAVLDHVALMEKQANLRAGLVAAVITNVHRKKGSRIVQPAEFLKGPRVQMAVEEAMQFMDNWAEGINAQEPSPVADPTLNPSSEGTTK